MSLDWPSWGGGVIGTQRSDRISVWEHAVNVILWDISLLCALERFCLFKAFSVLLNSFLLINIKEEQLTRRYFWKGLLWRLRRLQLLKQPHNFGQPWERKNGWVEVQTCLGFCYLSAGNWRFKLVWCRLIIICSDQHLTWVCYEPVSCFLITDCCITAQREIKSAW